MKSKVLALVMLIGSATSVVGCGDLGNVDSPLFVRYAPDGTLVVFTGSTIDVYDEQLTKRTASIPVPYKEGFSSNEFSLSDDGTLAALTDYDLNANRSKIDLFSIPGGGRPPSIDLGPPPDMPQAYAPEDLALSPHGDLVYLMGGVADNYRQVAMVDTATGAMLWSGDWAIAPAFSSDGSQLYVSGNQGQDVEGFDARSGASILNAPVMRPADAIAATVDPHTLVGLFGATIELLSTADGSVISQFEAVSDTEGLYGATLPLGLPTFRCSPQAGLCAVGVDEIVGVMPGPAPGDPPIGPKYGDSRVKIWSLTGTLIQTLSANADDVAISPDGQFVAVADNYHGDAEVFRISDGSLVNTHHYGGSAF